jgi:two-component system, sensor histidine kinase and response regulator
MVFRTVISGSKQYGSNAESLRSEQRYTVGYQILLVDDDPALLEALSETVRLRLNATVDVCGDGFDAMERILTIDYDAIVGDIRMPQMDGLTLMAQVRTFSPTTPVILITGHGDFDLIFRARASGAYACLQKPIEREHFIACLKGAVRVAQPIT